jgi:hypothetical protein
MLAVVKAEVLVVVLAVMLTVDWWFVYLFGRGWCIA